MEPKSYRAIIQAVVPMVDKKADWKTYEVSNDEKFVELAIADGDFLRVNIKDFMILPKSHFNLYIKIGPGNFIKIVNAGEEHVEEILNKYSEKGFPHVFIPKEEHERYVALCEKMSRKFIGSPAPANEKAKQVFRLGNEVIKNIAHLGIEPKNLDYAESFLDQSVALIKNYQIKDGNLQKFISSIQGNEHATAVSFLAGVLANELGFESKKSVKLVGISALVHDIGLHDLAPDVEEDKLAPDNDFFLKHPKHGADLLRKSGCFDEVVCLAVEQHHHRRRGSDQSKRNNNMNLVSEIVGVSDAFFSMVIKEGFSPKKLDEFLAEELPTFSHHIEKGLLKVLDKKRKAG
jgi:putative nucleotidyltransferase with HDIG domain